MAKLNYKTKSDCVIFKVNDPTYIVLEKADFPHDIDAGHIDRFIEKTLGKVICRDMDKPNGVTVTHSEIVIALNYQPSQKDIQDIIAMLTKDIVKVKES